MENTASLKIKVRAKLDELCKCTRGPETPEEAVQLVSKLREAAEQLEDAIYVDCYGKRT